MQSPDQSPELGSSDLDHTRGDTLTVVFNAFGATYRRKDHPPTTVTIDGNFTQMGNELPLVLKKS